MYLIAPHLHRHVDPFVPVLFETRILFALHAAALLPPPRALPLPLRVLSASIDSWRAPLSTAFSRLAGASRWRVWTTPTVLRPSKPPLTPFAWSETLKCRSVFFVFCVCVRVCVVFMLVCWVIVGVLGSLKVFLGLHRYARWSSLVFVGLRGLCECWLVCSWVTVCVRGCVFFFLASLC